MQALYLQTLSVAKEMRPKARWGWYDYPACSWGRGADMCSGDGLRLNAELDWLWRKVDFFAPSIYLCSQHTCSSHDAAENARRTTATISSVANISARRRARLPPAILPSLSVLARARAGVWNAKTWVLHSPCVQSAHDARLSPQLLASPCRRRGYSVLLRAPSGLRCYRSR